MIFRDVKIKKK